MRRGFERLEAYDFRIVLADDKNPRFADFTKNDLGRVQTIHVGHGDVHYDQVGTCRRGMVPPKSAFLPSTAAFARTFVSRLGSLIGGLKW